MGARIAKKQYQDLYQQIDGLYTSYWVGKLVNVMVDSGHKYRVECQLQRALLGLKAKSPILPLEHVLYELELIKPIFALRYLTVAGRQKDYPILLSRPKQLALAARWFKTYVNFRIEHTLAQRICIELLESRTKRSALVKRRDTLFSLAIANRFNSRFLRVLR